MKNRPSKFCQAIFAFILFTVFVGMSISHAQNTDQPTPQIALNADIVKRFVTTFKSIQELQKQVPKSQNKNEEEEEVVDALAITKIPALKEKFDAILKANGFNTIEEWSQTTQSVMLAYGYADPESGLGDLESNIKKSIDDIKTDKNLSEAEKQDAIKNLEEEFANIEKSKPLPGNVEAVKPLMSDIRSAVEGE